MREEYTDSWTYLWRKIKPFLRKWGWNELIKNHLQLNHTFAFVRRLQREGWRRALHRHRLWVKILATPPVITNEAGQAGPVEVHLLCYRLDYLPAIWTLKSFYRYAGVQYPLVIHINGRASRLMMRRLRQHFPKARIVSQAAADAEVEAWLRERGLVRLIEGRKRVPLMLKLTDFPLLSRAEHVLALDPDVLFFASPTELLQATQQPLTVHLFQRERGLSGEIPCVGAATGNDFPLEVNSGIMLYRRASLDLHECERYLSHPVLARELRRKAWVIEQTLYTLCASARNAVAYLPDSYAISLADDVDLVGGTVVARHYFGPTRHLLTEEGMPWLLRRGGFEQLCETPQTGQSLGSSPHRQVDSAL